jgi:hypothetical protein
MSDDLAASSELMSRPGSYVGGRVSDTNIPLYASSSVEFSNDMSDKRLTCRSYVDVDFLRIMVPTTELEALYGPSVMLSHQKVNLRPNEENDEELRTGNLEICNEPYIRVQDPFG